MTDRQTKSTWWSVTAFNNEIALLEDSERMPPFVKKVFGGREECPKTKTLHFQGALQCNQQVRMSQIKSWLKTAHLEPARDKECLKKYAMKAETAVGEKTVTVNANPYYPAHEILQLIGDQLTLAELSEDNCFYLAVNRLLKKNKILAGQLMNPSLKKFFLETRYSWQSSVIVLPEDKAERSDLCSGRPKPCGRDTCVECYEIECKLPEYISIVYNGSPQESPRRQEDQEN